MKKVILPCSGLLLVALAAAALLQVPAKPPRTLEELVPAGPLLVLQARDFAALVKDWNGSPEKALWLKSDNYEVFSRSRLFLRFGQEHEKFTAAAAFAPDMSTLDWLAGGDSVLALYNIGKLEFLYITRNAPARAMQGLLWNGRGYDARNSAGLPFVIRTDPQRHRVAAFAVTGDLLLAATREDLIAGALSLIAGNASVTVKSEPWFDRSVRATTQPQGDLRLVMNLEKIVASGYFKHYWIQQNSADWKPYVAGISDLYRSPVEIREERILLRDQPSSPVKDAPVAEVLRLAPPDAGLNRAWAAPSVNDALALLQRKILAPQPVRYAERRTAPMVSTEGVAAGSEGDLETRIDQAPLENAGDRFASEPVRKLIEGNSLDAMLEVSSSQAMPDGVFMGFTSAVVLLGSADWNPDAARTALLDAMRSLWTTSGLGANWAARGSGARAHYELDGLSPISVATRGRCLVLATDPKAIEAILAGFARPAANGAAYSASFQLARERANFDKMMALVDHSLPEQPAWRREPRFFSQNIGSLGRTLGRVQSESIVVRDTGAAVSQTVTYRLGK